MGGGRGRHATTDALGMLERCHDRLAENIEMLALAAARWAHNRDRGSLDDARAVAKFLARTATRHEADEEESVFPRLPRSDELDQVIRVLVAEHRDHQREIAHLTLLVAGKPDPAELTHVAQRLRSAYRAHIALEDAELTPRVRQLPALTLADIHAEMQARRGR